MRWYYHHLDSLRLLYLYLTASYCEWLSIHLPIPIDPPLQRLIDRKNLWPYDDVSSSSLSLVFNLISWDGLPSPWSHFVWDDKNLIFHFWVRKVTFLNNLMQKGTNFLRLYLIAVWRTKLRRGLHISHLEKGTDLWFWRTLKVNQEITDCTLKIWDHIWIWLILQEINLDFP